MPPELAPTGARDRTATQVCAFDLELNPRPFGFMGGYSNHLATLSKAKCVFKNADEMFAISLLALVLLHSLSHSILNF